MCVAVKPDFLSVISTMKTPIILALALVAGLVFAVLRGFRSTSRLRPYNPEQIKGNVRVVLLRVDRTTVFTDEGFREIKPQRIHAIPGLSVIYAVELLGDEPVKHWNLVSDGKLASVKGKTLGNTTPENIAAGGGDSSHEYEHYSWGMLKKPAVTNAKRTHVIEMWQRGLRVPSGKIDLRITTGFNDHHEEFVFENIPVE